MSGLAPQPRIGTADLFDLNDGAVEVIDLQFRAFGQVATFFGPCATLRVLEDHRPVLAILQEPGQGRVLVVDGGGSLRVGVMGDRLAGIAVRNDWRGVVIAGAVRDGRGIDALALGVRALGTTARRGAEPAPSDRGVDLDLGGAAIRPGDWVYADEDAVLVARGPLELPPDVE